MSARAVLVVGFVAVIGAAALLLSRRAAGHSLEEPSDLADAAALDTGVAPFDFAASVSDVAEAALDSLDDFTFSLVGHRIMSSTRWEQAAGKPENAVYVNAAHEAEARYGIPSFVVVRLMWQESRFKPDAFNKRSGATGIMQIVPRWHPDVNAWDPVAAIDYGARYLASLYRQFGTWELALKAYNWGPGNVSKWLKSERTLPEPMETQNYSRQILADVVVATGQALA